MESNGSSPNQVLLLLSRCHCQYYFIQHYFVNKAPMCLNAERKGTKSLYPVLCNIVKHCQTPLACLLIAMQILAAAGEILFAESVRIISILTHSGFK